MIFERLQGKKSAYRALPAVVRTIITFLIVTIAWVFFRAPDIQSAFTYLLSMFGVGEPAATASLVTGILFSPYSIIALLSAAAVTWFAPQTWDFTRAINPPKAALTLFLLFLSLLIMSTQSFNPFIYFIF